MQIFTHLTANDIQLKPFEFKRELSMEAYLLENEGVLALDDDTFSDVEIIEAELAIKMGRKSKDTDGRIDILATYSQEYIAVVELKLGQLESIHLTQIEDYLLKKEEILAKAEGLSEELRTNPKWIGVLVGSSIEASLASKLKQGYFTASGIQVAALTTERFRSSDGNVYVITNTYFNNAKSTKDRTQYMFNGLLLNKRKLVHAVVKKYVEDHPGITYAELEKVFPKKCHGTHDVFLTVEKAKEKEEGKRHFVAPDALISLSDNCTIAVCNQWGKENLEKFLKQARQNGAIIKIANG